MESGALVLIIISIIYWVLNKRWSRRPTDRQLEFVQTCCRERGVSPPENQNDFDAVRDWLDEHGYYIGARKAAERKQFIAMQGIIIGSVMLAAAKSGGVAGMVAIIFWLAWTSRVTANKSKWLAVIQSLTITFSALNVKKQIMGTMSAAQEMVSLHNTAAAFGLFLAIIALCVVIVLYFWNDLEFRVENFHKQIKRDGLVRTIKKYIAGELRI